MNDSKSGGLGGPGPAPRVLVDNELKQELDELDSRASYLTMLEPGVLPLVKALLAFGRKAIVREEATPHALAVLAAEKRLRQDAQYYRSRELFEAAARNEAIANDLSGAAPVPEHAPPDATLRFHTFPCPQCGEALGQILRGSYTFTPPHQLRLMDSKYAHLVRDVQDGRVGGPVSGTAPPEPSEPSEAAIEAATKELEQMRDEWGPLDAIPLMASRALRAAYRVDRGVTPSAPEPK